MADKYVEVVVKIYNEQGVTPEKAQEQVWRAIDQAIDAGKFTLPCASVSCDEFTT